MTLRRNVLMSASFIALAASAASPAFALNPQPLPPKEKILRADRSLNPQPLPPISRSKLVKRQLRR